MLRSHSLRIFAIIAVILALGATWKWDEIQRLLALNSLFAEESITRNFSAMDKLFFHAELPMNSSAISDFPVNPQSLPPLDDWVEARSLTALVVLKDGEIAHEAYFRGTHEEDRRISWSVAKSWLSALVGILLEDGAIESLDDPVTRYAPELKGSAYDGATLRHVLQMASGVRFNEDYFDWHSDINRMGRVLALGGSMDKFVGAVGERDYQPGESFQYASIDTHVVGMVVRGATGRSVIELMAERLMEPLGLESRPYYITDRHGVAFVLGGLNMTTRDYARFGQLYLQQGHWKGQQLVPAHWVAESTVPSSPTPEGHIQYGLKWWIPEDASEGEYLARGVYGQFIYINEPAGVVIAMNAADRAFLRPGSFQQNLAMFRRIVETLGGEESSAL
ncbi:MAG: beta-lactamase family protein [Marinobacter sp.]|nr:beta-lactamase family protein [Marinobacter sp.]